MRSFGDVTDADGTLTGCEVHRSRRSPCRRVIFPKIRVGTASCDYQSPKLHERKASGLVKRKEDMRRYNNGCSYTVRRAAAVGECIHNQIKCRLVFKRHCGSSLSRGRAEDTNRKLLAL